MLAKKENNTVLSIVKKPALKVIRMKPADKKKAPQPRRNAEKLPPRNQFNTGYIKARDNDPL